MKKTGKKKPKGSKKPKQYCLTEEEFVEIDPETMPIMYSILMAFRELSQRPTIH